MIQIWLVLLVAKCLSLCKVPFYSIYPFSRPYTNESMSYDITLHEEIRTPVSFCFLSRDFSSLHS